MPPPSGAPKAGRKRIRRDEVPFNLADTGFFPMLEDPSNGEREEYIRISSLVPDRPMMSLNQYVVKKEVNLITKNWSNFGRTREGDILLKVKGEKDIDKLKKTEKIGIWPVNITKDEVKNSVKGVVFCRDLIHLTDEEVLEAFDGWCKDTKKSYGVKAVYVPKRLPLNRNSDQHTNETKGNSKESLKGNVNDNGQNEASKGTPKPFGLVIITFDALSLPATISYGFDTLVVRPYVPNPMRCHTCQALGHTKKRCHSPTVCEKCGKPESQGHICEGEFCVNCNAEGHLASNRTCQAYLVWKEYEAIQVNLRKTRHEAKKYFFECYGNADNFIKSKNLKVAKIVRGNDKTTSNVENNKGIENAKVSSKEVRLAKPKSPETMRRLENFKARLGRAVQLAQDAEMIVQQTETAGQGVVSPNSKLTEVEQMSVELTREANETTNVENTNNSMDTENLTNEDQKSEEELIVTDDDNMDKIDRVDLSKLLNEMKSNKKDTENLSKNKKKQKNDRKNKKERKENGSASESTSDTERT